MKRFGYLRDPLCIAACALYLLNRGGLREHIGGVFLRGHFNDLLLIPAALPLVLWVQRRIGTVQIVLAKPRWRGHLATAEAPAHPSVVSEVSA